MAVLSPAAGGLTNRLCTVYSGEYLWRVFWGAENGYPRRPKMAPQTATHALCLQEVPPGELTSPAQTRSPRLANRCWHVLQKSKLQRPFRWTKETKARGGINDCRRQVAAKAARNSRHARNDQKSAISATRRKSPLNADGIGPILIPAPIDLARWVDFCCLAVHEPDEQIGLFSRVEAENPRHWCVRRIYCLDGSILRGVDGGKRGEQWVPAWCMEKAVPGR